MKAKIFILGLLLVLISGCETRTFNYVSTVTKRLEYPVNQTGAFVETKTIFANEINDDLDLPEDAIIGDVYIEALTIAIDYLDGNEASAVSIDGYVGDEPFVNDELVAIPEGSYEFTAMANLLVSGVKAMGDAFEGFVIASDPPSIVFRLEGDSHPVTGQRLHFNIIIEFTVTVVYAIETEFIAT